ncbi:MAG: hypothetical protein ACJ79H_03490 [Myxococcales bacterium]
MADRVNVFDLHGRPVGATDDPEALFLNHVRLLFHRQPELYVVCGDATSDAFRATLEEIGCPFIDDARIGERALIMEGSPLEWEQLASGAEAAIVDPEPE